MHRFPLSAELSFLIGTELTQIIIDPYEVRFLLTSSSSRVELRSGHAFTYSFEGAEDFFEPGVGCWTQAPVRFHALLYQTISTVTTTAEGDEMTLTFQCGERLTIHSDVGGMYESGMVSGIMDGKSDMWVF